jgi:hypothetical protein
MGRNKLSPVALIAIAGTFFEPGLQDISFYLAEGLLSDSTLVGMECSFP